MELISNTKGQVFSSGASNVRSFQMKVCAKAFDAAIAGLYSNKIKAVIRELSTNAYEAHQLLKIEDKPFNVKLPSQYDPIFKIRDFGPGISDEDIGKIYITLYESTKETSNEFGGAFGLGSKSPYAYTNNFSVISVHKGMKTIYALARDSNGIPCISTLATMNTTEPSGIEIEIPVNTYDIPRFVEEAKNVYKWFKTKPLVTGNNSYSEVKPEPSIISGTNWRLTSGSELAVAVMGNIAYPLSHYSGNNSNLVNKRGLILDFNIGDLEPTPSRESLSFNTETIDAIKRRLNVIITEYSALVQKELDKETTKWNTIIKYNELSSNAIFPVNLTYDGKPISNHFSLKVDPNSYNSKLYVESLQEVSGYSSIKYYFQTEVYPNKTVTFLVNDKPSYAKIRIRNFKSAYSGKLYLLNEDELVAFKAIVDCEDSHFKLVSDLPKPVINRTSNAKKSKVLKYNNKGSYNNQCWEEAEIDDTTEGYFVTIKNNKIIFDDKEYSPVDFQYIFDYINSKLKTPVELYGVKKGGSSEELETYKDLMETYFDEVMATEDIALNANAIYSQCSSKHYPILSFLSNTKLDDIKHDVIKDLRSKYLTIQSEKHLGVSSNVITIMNLVFPNKKFTKKANVKSTFLTDIIEFEKKYPLVRNISHLSIDSNFAKELEYYFIGKDSE